ncbi:Hint domain-containing protein [Acidimangrovimonas pyrenivorans]|uniref:Hint domain-containing protein n=1 Tax=Acidimangrovimonas pyrenivorans TaxID=2030798 RepID=A0ABV7AM47_9RHOB
MDGVHAAPLKLLGAGASWSWRGRALRVDGPQGLMRLEGDAETAALRRRAARMARRLSGAAMAPQQRPAVEPAEIPPTDGFVVTDGYAAYEATVIAAPEDGSRLLVFSGEMPPVDRELWVVRSTLVAPPCEPAEPERAGVICFTPGTLIATPLGARRIESLRPGERVLTKDNGPQPVLWTGHRRFSGARLFALPHLRPIRFRAGALGLGRPEDELLVSPQHRMLVQGAAARALFNTDEVLVAAEDLVDGRAVTVDALLPQVTYVHVLLERHEIVWANGLETESFHPSNTSLQTIDPAQRAALFAALPELATDPEGYGSHARRNLSRPEAAILRHDAA